MRSGSSFAGTPSTLRLLFAQQFGAGRSQAPCHPSGASLAARGMPTAAVKAHSAPPLAAKRLRESGALDRSSVGPSLGLIATLSAQSFAGDCRAGGARQGEGSRRL
jgi:hypothetical protein